MIVTYPFLPVIPIATPDFGGKDPSLSPQQKQHPEGDEQVWEAQEAARSQVELDLLGNLHGDIAQSDTVRTIPESPYSTRSDVGLGDNIFENGL